MASRGIVNALLIVALVVMICGRATAQSGCTQAIIGMSPCLNYITGNSSTPSTTCCSQLGNVVQSQPQCLCTLLNGGGGVLGIAINQTLALALPRACNLQTPPVSQCNAASGGPSTSAATPATSPVGTPSADTPDIPTTPTESNVPSGSGSKTVPTTNGSPSDGSYIKVPLNLVVSILFVLSCASAVTRF